MDELLKLANNYDTANFLHQIHRIQEDDLNRFFDLFFSLGNTHIHQHDKSKRSKRDGFLNAVVAFCVGKFVAWESEEVVSKLKIIYCAEELFDEIKNSLKKTELTKLPSDQQCWAQIARVENELIKIERLLSAKFENREEKDKVLNVSERVKIQFNGAEVDPDFAIEQIVTSLSLSLTLLGHQNKWFDEVGKLILPATPQGKFEDRLEAAEVANLATTAATSAANAAAVAATNEAVASVLAFSPALTTAAAISTNADFIIDVTTAVGLTATAGDKAVQANARTTGASISSLSTSITGLSAYALISATAKNTASAAVVGEANKVADVYSAATANKWQAHFFVDGQHIGGNDKLQALENEGKLNSLLGI